MISSHIAIWSVALLVAAGVVIRPWQIPEAVYAVGGAVASVVFGLIGWPIAARAVGRGTDVYLFLAGMMMLSELARREGLFEVVADRVIRQANGSASRLFGLVYAVGVVVTVFLSNDATAVVLTPAVYAMCKRGGVAPLPYLMACAMVANAASFVLPISNPANLVIYGGHLPGLVDWLARFAGPSIASIGVTFGVLRWRYRRDFAAADVTLDSAGKAPAEMSESARWALAGIGLTAVVLLGASARGTDLGWPTAAMAAFTVGAVSLRQRRGPWQMMKQISWSVLPLVAGLFVLVDALATTGVQRMLAESLGMAAQANATGTTWLAGGLLAIGSNLVNNLPAGLMAGSVANAVEVTPAVKSVLDAALAIGVDLGPNLSVTGSLATLLWLAALRREGEQVSAWVFFKLGIVAMPLAWFASMAALWTFGR